MGEKAVKTIRKRFTTDENNLGPAQLAVGSTPRVKAVGRRRLKGQSAQQSAHQFVQGMRVKRGGGLFF